MASNINPCNKSHTDNIGVIYNNGAWSTFYNAVKDYDIIFIRVVYSSNFYVTSLPNALIEEMNSGGDSAIPIQGMNTNDIAYFKKSGDKTSILYGALGASARVYGVKF